MTLPAESLFKAYDIRGIVGKTLTAPVVRQIGQAIGSEALARGQRRVVVGRDGRLSGQEFASALAEGLLATGVDVIDIGCVATPISYFAAQQLGTHSCVSLTGSHNPPEYNGIKVVLADETLHGAMIRDLRRRIVEGDLANGQGRLSHADVRSDYIARIVSDVRLQRPMRVVIDCGNGVAGNTAPALFRQLGCTVHELYSEVDGHFPNHHPDPSRPENLADLIGALRAGAGEIGLAFDGDGDRLGVVTPNGHIVYPDRQLMLFVPDVLARHPGATVIFDAKCSRHVARCIREHGGEPLMWQTGHALIKAKLRETGAPLGGELSGHLFFKDRWYGFDDGLYAGARLLEILSRSDDAAAMLEALPDSQATPELQLELNEGEAPVLVEALRRLPAFSGEIARSTIDGLRIEYADGFGLARASNTTPILIFRFEADDQAGLERIRQAFARALDQVRPGTRLPTAAAH